MQRWVAQVALILSALLGSTLSSFGAEPVSEQSEQFFDLPLTGAVKLENTDGTIYVVGWYVPRVRVAAVRKAYTAERLRQIRVETTSHSDSLVIRTIIPQIRGLFADRSGTVGYTVTVPETAQLALTLANGEVNLQGLRGGTAKVELTNGRISAIDCFARIEARATTGMMEILFNWWENLPASFNYVLQQGTIMARLPGAARFRIDAQTSEGWIHHAFELPAANKKGGGQSLNAVNGPNPIVSLGLRASDGNISIDLIR